MSLSPDTPVPSCPARGLAAGPKYSARALPHGMRCLGFGAGVTHTWAVLLGRGCQCVCLSQTSCSEHPSCARTGNDSCVGFTSLDANQRMPLLQLVSEACSSL